MAWEATTGPRQTQTCLEDTVKKLQDATKEEEETARVVAAQAEPKKAQVSLICQITAAAVI